ncbi:hypothetical protein [Ferruginibacter sp.]|nr:hypothetical protein [Ferruginibacter sp.]
MKKKIQLLALALFIFITATIAQNKPAAWAEMKAFHSLMSTSFHPSEEGNLTPLKQQADSMFIAAKQWQASPIPDTYKPKETKKALKQLVKECKGIKNAVAANAADDELKKKIAAAHDVFHTIVKECKKEEEAH